MGRIGGYAHDGDVEGPRGFQVDVVVTGTAQRQQSHAVACQFAHHFGVGRIVDEDTRRLRAVRGDDRLTAEMAFEIAEFESEIAVQCVERLLFVGLRPEEGDDGFHGSCVLSCCSNVKRCRQITCRSLKIGVSEPKSRSDVKPSIRLQGEWLAGLAFQGYAVQKSDSDMRELPVIGRTKKSPRPEKRVAAIFEDIPSVEFRTDVI